MQRQRQLSAVDDDEPHVRDARGGRPNSDHAAVAVSSPLTPVRAKARLLQQMAAKPTRYYITSAGLGGLLIGLAVLVLLAALHLADGGSGKRYNTAASSGASAAAFSTSLTRILAEIEAQHAATTSLLSTHQSLATFQAIQPLSPTYTTEWAPRVLHADVSQFESDAVAQVGSPTWGLSTANISTTGTYTDYFPVMYAHPPSLARFLVDTRPSLASNATTTSSTASTTSLSTVTRHSTTDAILGVTITTINWANLIATTRPSSSLHLTIHDSTTTTTTCSDPSLFDGLYRTSTSQWHESGSTRCSLEQVTTTAPLGSRQLTLRASFSDDSETVSALAVYAIVFAVTAAALLLALARHAHSRQVLLKTAAKSAHDEDQQTKRFLSFITHELRNPLFAVQGTTGELRASIQDGGHNELINFVDTIGTACDRMTSIVNDVLSMRKLEEGKLELEVTTFSPRSVVHELRTLFRHRADERSIVLVCEVAGGVPHAVKGDEGRIVQMLSNLASNALKFTPEDGTITLCVTRKSTIVGEDDQETDTLRFSVSDTGCGISPEGLERIFEPYVQASADVERKHGGTGLGLSIVRMMAEAMGGEVAATSERHAGSTFFIDLPLEVAVRVRSADGLDDLGDRACSTPPLVVSSGGQLRAYKAPTASSRAASFLVVDDIAVNTRLLKFMIKRALPGARVDALHSGQEALDAVRWFKYGMVFMDVNMPGMGGRQAAKAMRSSGYNQPIIAVTGSDSAREAELNERAGYTATATKPLKKATLLQLLQRHMELQVTDVGADVHSNKPTSPPAAQARKTTPTQRQADMRLQAEGRLRLRALPPSPRPGLD